jgi:hypothetical protein
MFLNWVDRGMLTGIAIHGVVGHEIASLGERASAGCIRLSPQAAAMLFELVKNNYRGEIPEFSYDVNTATLSRDGALARREDGGIRYTDGYRVLIFIDNFGGEDPTAIF